MTNPSNTSVTAQFGAGEREEKTKLAYVKRWRTIVGLPKQYADEIVEALRAAPVSHTSVKAGGGAQCACMRGGYPIGNCVECDDPAARDAVADGATRSGTFASVVVKRMQTLIETADKGSAWEMEAVAEMMKAAHLIVPARCTRCGSSGDTYVLCSGCGAPSAPVKAVGSEALRLLAAEDARQEKLHELLETIREQIRLGVEPEHRPDGLFQNIQDAVYAMRGRTLLMNDVAITAALAHPGSGDAEPGARNDIIDLLRDPSSCVTREDAVAEILRLRGVLEELAVGFDRARSATTYTAEAQRLNRCAEFCRTAQTTNNGVSP